MARDEHDTQTLDMIEHIEQVTAAPAELTDDDLSAAGLQRTVAYVKTGKVKKKKGSAERMARKRERDAAAGIVTKALLPDDQEALDMGKKILGLKGWRRRLVLRWIRD